MSSAKPKRRPLLALADVRAVERLNRYKYKYFTTKCIIIIFKNCYLLTPDPLEERGLLEALPLAALAAPLNKPDKPPEELFLLL